MAQSEDRLSDATRALLHLMARLRDREHGCPWDAEQTFATIAPYTIEESYEVADAIQREDMPALKEELGDLLFQVVFHARMAEEAGLFNFTDVAEALTAKMTTRHPHVFGDVKIGSVAEQNRAWEEHKARERAGRPEAAPSELADVPLALPALARAAKLGKRAARVGFDWPDASGVRAKIEEELAETDAVAPAGAADGRRAEELGDLLFAVANWSRHLKVDPEEALRLANAKFERRFRAMEHLARERSLTLSSLDAAAWDALWNEVKSREKTAQDHVQ